MTGVEHQPAPSTQGGSTYGSKSTRKYPANRHVGDMSRSTTTGCRLVPATHTVVKLPPRFIASRKDTQRGPHGDDDDVSHHERASGWHSEVRDPVLAGRGPTADQALTHSPAPPPSDTEAVILSEPSTHDVQEANAVATPAEVQTPTVHYPIEQPMVEGESAASGEDFPVGEAERPLQEAEVPTEWPGEDQSQDVAMPINDTVPHDTAITATVAHRVVAEGEAYANTQDSDRENDRANDTNGVPSDAVKEELHGKVETAEPGTLDGQTGTVTVPGAEETFAWHSESRLPPPEGIEAVATNVKVFARLSYISAV